MTYGCIEFVTTSKFRISFNTYDQILTILHPKNRHGVAAKYDIPEASAQQMTEGSTGRALKSSAGGLIAGGTFLPVVGTIYGIGRGIANARAATIHIVGPEVDIAIETTWKRQARQLVAAINGTTAY